NEHGEIIETITYDEHYGSILEHKRRNNNETLNPYGYTGREIEMNDLYYYRARYYDSSTQRFLSLDPIGFSSGDFNFYRYVGNSPVGWIDPFGLKQGGKWDSILEAKDNIIDWVGNLSDAVIDSVTSIIGLDDVIKAGDMADEHKSCSDRIKLFLIALKMFMMYKFI
ncbi:MAG: RHS repeat-associated protein, partial [uncultured Sulfurovum sp.]